MLKVNPIGLGLFKKKNVIVATDAIPAIISK